MKAFVLIAGVLFSLCVRAGDAPVFVDVAKDAEGRLVAMWQWDAVDYCAARGDRLPTTRELAQFAMSHGAKGIVDKCDSKVECGEVHAVSPDGSVDIFNYSSTGYQRPTDDIGRYWFWSSSLNSYHDAAFYLNGADGDIGYVLRDFKGAVACVSNH